MVFWKQYFHDSVWRQYTMSIILEGCIYGEYEGSTDETIYF